MVHLSRQTLRQVISNGSSTEMAYDERRRAPRLATAWASTAVPMCGSHRGKPLNVKVRDISTGGAGLIVPGRAEVGQRLALCLPRNAQTSLWVECQVRHCEPLDSTHYGVGVQFMRLLQPSAVPVSNSEALFLAPHDLTAEEDKHVRQLQRKLLNVLD